MARSGVLSDSSIKHTCPEFFPPDIFTQSTMHPVAFQRNMYPGIKIPLETRTYAFSRFPASDMHNMGTLLDPARADQIASNSIRHYRAEIGATDSSFATETDDQFDDTIPLHSVPGSLTLRRSSRIALQTIEAEIPGISGVFEPRTQLMLATLAPGGNYDEVLNAIGFGVRGGRMSHGQVLSKLQTYYRGSDRDIDKLEQANAAADALERMESKRMFAMNIVSTQQDASQMLTDQTHEDEWEDE